MDHFLKPDGLKKLSEDPGVAKAGLHEYWFKTFESVLPVVTKITENEEAVNRWLANKSLSPQTCSYISENT